MSKIPILIFRLEGLLQSWGEHSKWDYRDTSEFPSKSAVTGLLACALGWDRGDERIAELCDSIDMIVRADRRGEIMQDYHTVSGDVILNAEGKRRPANTIVSKRFYLQDASFLVGISSDRKILEACKNALENPKWELYLGRKSCVPSCPIIGEITDEYGSLMEAMAKIALTERHDDIVLVQRDAVSGTTTRRMDVTVNSSRRIFEPRFVETVVLENGGESFVSN